MKAQGIQIKLPQNNRLIDKWNVFFSVLLPLSLMNLVVSIFLIDDHIAIHSITFCIVLGLLVLQSIISKTIPKGIPTWLLVYISLGYLFFVIGSANSTGISSDSVFLIRRWKIFVVYALVFYFLPTQKKEIYFTLMLLFCIMVLLFNTYTLYKYYDLIIVNNGKSLPDASWINFMDLMKPYILPLDFYHHTLSLFNTLSLLFVYFMWNKTPKLKYFFHFFDSFFCIYDTLLWFSNGNYRILFFVFNLFIHL